jgi:hypothetical protein
MLIYTLEKLEPVLGEYFHFNIPIGDWYYSFFNLDIRQGHEYSNVLQIDISSKSI